MGIRKLSVNASAAVAQTVIGSVIVVGLYAVMVEELGLSTLGIWSLLMSIATVGKIGEAGLGATIMRFAAKDLGGGAEDMIRPMLMTGLVLVFLMTSLLAILFFPLLRWLLTQLIDEPESLSHAIRLLPFALLIMVAMACVSIVFGVIDAMQRTWARSLVVVSAGILQLLAAHWILPAYGITGLAWLQVMHAATLFLGGSIALGLMVVKTNGSWSWLSRTRLREMLWFGGGLQISSIAQLLFDPCTKALITLFGGLGMTGSYELASRAVTQLRGIVISAFSLLIPFVAGRFPSSSADSPELIRPYQRSYMLMQIVVFGAFPLLLASFPVFFPIWVKSDSEALIIMASACAIGWAINMMAAPAYLIAIATGKVRWIVESHATVAFLTPILATIGGFVAQAPGVAAGAMSALALGSLTVTMRLHISLNQRFRQLLSGDLISLFGICMALSLWLSPAMNTLWPALQEPFSDRLPANFSAIISLLLLAVFSAAGHLWLVRDGRLRRLLGPLTN